VIRSALSEYAGRESPRPRLPLIRGEGSTNIAERVDELLATPRAGMRWHFRALRTTTGRGLVLLPADA
jgi:hypothetical protein